MRYKLLGKSGLRVSELCLGAMVLGGDGGATREESGRILDAFAEAGGNFIDTADAYSQGTSERYVGEWLGARRDEFVVATKYTLSRKASQIKENLGALEVELSEDQRARLDEASAIELGFPCAKPTSCSGTRVRRIRPLGALGAAARLDTGWRQGNGTSAWVH